jgi:hypothetical protein
MKTNIQGDSKITGTLHEDQYTGWLKSTVTLHEDQYTGWLKNNGYFTWRPIYRAIKK